MSKLDELFGESTSEKKVDPSKDMIKAMANTGSENYNLAAAPFVGDTADTEEIEFAVPEDIDGYMEGVFEEDFYAYSPDDNPMMPGGTEENEQRKALAELEMSMEGNQFDPLLDALGPSMSNISRFGQPGGDELNHSNMREILRKVLRSI